MTSGVALGWNVFLALRKLILISSDTTMLSQPAWLSIFPIFLPPVSPVDHGEEDLLSDRGFTQHPGGVDQGPAEHTQSPGQQPGRRRDHCKAQRARLAHKGQEPDAMICHLTIVCHFGEFAIC